MALAQPECRGCTHHDCQPRRLASESRSGDACLPVSDLDPTMSIIRASSWHQDDSDASDSELQS
eukprot:1266786-Rhodomonas_salina.2